MTNDAGDDGATRPYRKTKRARQEADTRRRITEAVVELHRTVGPARTTVTEVAERAGVSRVTVYNHFPTEAELIQACSTHWSERNPPPDPAPWAAVADPADRTALALRTLYAWYRSTEDMMGKVLRDAPLVEPLAEVVEDRWQPFVDTVVDLLAAAWEVDADIEARAALRLVVDFGTWARLTGAGLDDAGAADLAARMAEAGVRAAR